MELILKTDVRASVPEIIEFNYEELQAYLGERLEKYRTLVVAEDGIKAAKSDRAALNKLRSALEDSRKGVKADCLRPYESFEVKIKALTGMIEGAIQNIDTQVKGFEEAKKQEKRAKIEAFFAENIGNLAELLPLEKLWTPKWLNATVKLPAVQEEILASIRRVKNDIGIIRAMKVGCEAQMIDRYLQTLDMSAALAEKTRFEEQQKKLAEYQARSQQQAPAEDKPAPAVQTEEPAQTATAQGTPAAEPSELRQIDFRVWVTPDQMRALRQFLIDNKIRYGRVQ